MDREIAGFVEKIARLGDHGIVILKHLGFYLLAFESGMLLADVAEVAAGVFVSAPPDEGVIGVGNPGQVHVSCFKKFS